MSSDFNLSPLIIIIVYIPGYLFRKFYFLGEFTKQFSIKEWARNLGINSLSGLFIQTLVIIVIQLCFEDSFKDLKSLFS